MSYYSFYTFTYQRPEWSSRWFHPRWHPRLYGDYTRRFFAQYTWRQIAASNRLVLIVSAAQKWVDGSWWCSWPFWRWLLQGLVQSSRWSRGFCWFGVDLRAQRAGRHCPNRMRFVLAIFGQSFNEVFELHVGICLIAVSCSQLWKVSQNLFWSYWCSYEFQRHERDFSVLVIMQFS